MTTVSIPSSLEGVTSRLGAIDDLIRVREWEKAALIAAFVRLDPGGGGPRRPAGKGRFVSATEFSELGIIGLRSKGTVTLYVQRWLDAHDGVYPEPGARVSLPTDDWPPTRTGTDGYESDDGADRTVERLIERHGPEIIARAARRPEVAAAVVTDMEAGRQVIRAQTKPLDDAKPRPNPRGGIVDSFTKLLQQIGAMAYAHDGAQLFKALQQRHQDDLPWKPGELEAVLRCVNEGIQHGENCRAMLTPVSDEALEKLLGS